LDGLASRHAFGDHIAHAVTWPIGFLGRGIAIPIAGSPAAIAGPGPFVVQQELQVAIKIPHSLQRFCDRV
jgi:hypothetical protein